MESRDSYRSLVILLVLALLCAWTVMAELTNARGFNGYCNDDAYISFTYARNFNQGRGLVFNAEERVEGYTNFLWILFLAPWMKWIPNIDVSTLAIFWGACFSVLVMILTYALGYQEHKHHWTNLIAPLLLSLDNSFHYWSISGLENALQSVLVLLGMFFLFLQGGRRLLIVAGAVFAMATMTRPDSGIFWAVAAGALLLRAARSHSEFSFKDPLLLASGFLVILIPYCAWKVAYYGDVLPNTFYLHTGNRIVRIEKGAAYLLRFLQNRFYLPLVAAGCILAGYNFRRAVLFLSVFCFGIYTVWIGGDFFPGSRFFYVILPMIYLLIQDLVAWLAERGSQQLAIGTALGCLVIGAGIFQGTYGPRGEYQGFVLTWAQDDLNRIQLAKDFSRIAKEGDSILSGPVGQIAYYSGMKVLDYWGVTDPHIARSNVANTDDTPGHEKSDLYYLLEKKPVYIIFGVDPKNPPAGYAPYEFHVDNRRWVVLKRSD